MIINKVAILCCLNGLQVSALRCYSCAITSQMNDQVCLNDPGNAEGQSVVNCNKKYCTIFRQELKEPAGKINSFVRGCEEVPTLLNDVIDDPVFKTYYRSCSTDLCNGGDGKDSGNNNLLMSDPNSYTGENLLVVGLPISSSKNLHLSILLICYCLITSIKIA